GACGSSRSACYVAGSGYISIETKGSQAGNCSVAVGAAELQLAGVFSRSDTVGSSASVDLCSNRSNSGLSSTSYCYVCTVDHEGGVSCCESTSSRTSTRGCRHCRRSSSRCLYHLAGYCTF